MAAYKKREAVQVGQTGVGELELEAARGTGRPQKGRGSTLQTQVSKATRKSQTPRRPSLRTPPLQVLDAQPEAPKRTQAAQPV